MTRRGRPPKTSREEIIAATLDVLRERGLARLTTREIASRMGISEGSIFYHFGDRKGLIKAVFDESLRPLLQFKTLPPEPPQNLDDLRAGIAYFTETVGNFLESGLDVLFATQADTRPPKFVIFASGFIEAGYRRFLERKLRERFGFEGSPIEISVRVRERRRR